MATYKVFGYGEKNKFYDEGSYRDAIHYITGSQESRLYRFL